MKRYAILSLLFICIALSASARRNDVLSYGTPESVGMNGRYLNSIIDSIAHKSITDRCFPGCQILVARRGKIVFNKSYGYHTYDSIIPVENSHLYDLASCTKAVATTLCMMRLVEQEQISLDKPISNYLDEFNGSNKANSTLREQLAHQAGFTAVSFSRMFLDEDRKLRADMFSTTQSEEFPYRFCDSIFVCKDIKTRWLHKIADSRLGKRRLRYSCLVFQCYPTIVERITSRNYENYLYEEFYTPLGVERAMFNPLRRYPLENIVPTEFDKYFNRQLVQGYVHDEAAASLGGVSGNAGLFANAESIAPILQMLLNRGRYNGVRYFKRSTVKEWTSCQYPHNGNHRALGFDRRRLTKKQSTKSYFSPSVSEKSFGHAGFTGTMVWVDPKEELLFIFLSNRVYPSRNNRSFSKSNPRSKVHEAAYEAIRKFRKR